MGRIRVQAAAPRLLAAAACALVVPAAACSGAPAAPRSVVLIVVDTLRADRLGAYGHGAATSAAFDARAARGAVFARAFAPSSWTLPSFASLYSGVWPAQHGVGREPGSADRYSALPARIDVLAEILAERGFETAAIVNNPFLHPGFGLARGFETYRYVYGNLKQQPRASQITWAGLRWLDERGQAQRAARRSRAEAGPREDPARPFLLVLHFFDPHLAYDPHPSVRGRFTAGYRGPLALPFGGVGPANASWAPADPEDRRFVAGAYDEEVLFVDRQLERLFAGLEERGLAGDTLVVLTADHGEELFDHGGFEHGHSLHQELLHVPLAVWGPGVLPGRIDVPVSLVDVLPTLLDALGLPPVPGIDGVSLWPLLARREPLPERPILAEGTLHGPERRALVRWPWKLLEVDGGAPRLFDLERDPGESRDLASAQPERVRALGGELAGLRAGAAPEAPAPEIDEQVRRDLSGLGYLE